MKECVEGEISEALELQFVVGIRVDIVDVWCIWAVGVFTIL